MRAGDDHRAGIVEAVRNFPYGGGRCGKASGDAAAALRQSGNPVAQLHMRDIRRRIDHGVQFEMATGESLTCMNHLLRRDELVVEDDANGVAWYRSRAARSAPRAGLSLSPAPFKRNP